MRSDLVFAARKAVPNPFALVRMVAKGARALHRGEKLSTGRLADTVNEVFHRIASPDVPYAPPNEPDEMEVTIF